jgi:adenosylhomocysteine nucleosidase
MSSEARADARAMPRTAIVAALAVERASVARHAGGWSVAESGPGAQRAAGSAEQAVAAGAAALVSWGLVGGLTSSLAAGTVVVPERVVLAGGASYATDASWRARLEPLRGAFAVRGGTLLTVSSALESPAAKAAAAAEHAAVAVDMEAAAVAAVAQRAGVPFVALRVVVDTLDDRLPAGVDAWVDAFGRTRSGSVLRGLVSPSEWPTLWRLGLRLRVARRVLDRLAMFVAARHLLDPPRVTE